MILRKELKGHMKVKFLDCTLRDGGYYTNWKFSHELINDYLYSMKEAKLDWIEFGFRFPKALGEKESCASTTDAFINSFSYSKELNIGVMINAADFTADEKIGEEILKKLFTKSRFSPVKLVRVACHYDEVEKSDFIFKFLLENGYKVGINLMQISEKSESELRKFSKFVSKYPFEVIYFADSLGSLTPKDIKRIVGCLKTYWKGDIGFHAHDNMGNALANCLKAMDEGVNWIDSTVLGMGRGPGNVETESLLMNSQDEVSKKMNLVPLLNTIDIHFKKLLSKHQWGKNPFYFLAGQNKIHPTFIQEMLSDSRYTNFDILQAINFFKEVGGQRFNKELLDSNKIVLKTSPKGSWKPAQVLKNKDVLIIGPSKKILKSEEIYNQVKKMNNLKIFSCNASPGFFKNLIDFHVACHPIRILADFSRYKELKKKLIIPTQILDSRMKKKLYEVSYNDFGVSINENAFHIEKDGAEIPFLNVLAYSLAIASSGMAKRVLLLGFDGYKKKDLRQKEMQKMFELFKKASKLKIYTLSKTSHGIPMFVDNKN